MPHLYAAPVFYWYSESVLEKLFGFGCSIAPYENRLINFLEGRQEMKKLFEAKGPNNVIE